MLKWLGLQEEPKEPQRGGEFIGILLSYVQQNGKCVLLTLILILTSFI